VINQSVLPARGQFGLEFREVGPAVMDDHHLAVDDGLTCLLSRKLSDVDFDGGIIGCKIVDILI
jgi:hypothetical protein